MKLYRKLVPEIIRIQIRNPQYILDDLKFAIRYFRTKNQNQHSKTFPKSICYIIPTTNITGGVAVVCEHLNRLKKLDYKTLITSYDNKTNLSWFPNQSVKVIPLKNNRKIIERYETVIATGWITAYELLLLNVKKKIYFVQSDETRFYPKNSYLKTRVKRTYTFPFNFMTPSKWIQRFLKEKFKKNSYYVPNGINTDIFHPDTPLEPKPKNKKRILLEGAINFPFKNMKEAFKVVQDLDCEVWCVSYDGKPKSDWHCDRFFEKVPMEQMRHIYSSCNILLKLSTLEGFGYPPLEMMACGGVSVVSEIEGHKEYIIDGYNAVFTGIKSTKKTKEIIKKLIKDKKLYKKIQNNSQKTIQQFNWQRTTKTLEKIFS